VEAVRAQDTAPLSGRCKNGGDAGSAQGLRRQRARGHRPQSSRRRPWEWLRDRARFGENLAIG
jgi:hypothetical protein